MGSQAICWDKMVRRVKREKGEAEVSVGDEGGWRVLCADQTLLVTETEETALL